MTKQGLAIACFFVVSGSQGVVRGDDLGSADIGTRVRVNSTAVDSARLVGTVIAVDPTSLTVLPEGGVPTVVARPDILRLEQSVRPSRRKRGAWIGFAVGALAAFAKVANQGGCNDGCNAANVTEGALVGLSTAVVGALVSPGERWVDMSVRAESGRATRQLEAGPQLRLVPHVGRAIGLAVVASF